MQNPEASVFKFIEKCYAAKLSGACMMLRNSHSNLVNFFFKCSICPKSISSIMIGICKKQQGGVIHESVIK